ncbi:MAG: sigma-54-dependent Fis family transcriptional regulator [Myxococcales bacterium]|nr:sigma-54-dependent Fis family transcriptional regulator [Myxococcales bacterium]
MTTSTTATTDAERDDDRLGPLLGRSAAMRELFARLLKIAATDAPAFIHGETGTGKELVARAVHERSTRARAPFVIVDCAALPDNLLEAELFGHARGAFTGAHTTREGAFESAAGGTVFLDEIGELPLSMQPKLLRVLESRTIRRIGESQHRPVDVRIVTATHRDVPSMVRDGAFREDLYFRLAVLPVSVPPLRERGDDVLLLARSFLPEALRHAPLDPRLVDALLRRRWPGNVRELRNTIKRVASLGIEEAIDTPFQAPSATTVSEFAHQAPPPLAPSLPETSPPTTMPGPLCDTRVPFKVLRDQWLDHLERSYITLLLAQHDRNITAVAAAAGLDRTYIHRLLKKHGL